MQLTDSGNSNASNGDCKLCGTSCVGLTLSTLTMLPPKG